MLTYFVVAESEKAAKELVEDLDFFPKDNPSFTDIEVDTDYDVEECDEEE